MMIPSFLLSNHQLRMMKDRKKREVERRIPLAVPWDPEMKWDPELNIQAKTYKVFSLFKVPHSNSPDPHFVKPENLILSPDKNFCYYEVRIPRGTMLLTMNGRNKGDVLFDGPVTIPKIHDRERWSGGGWNCEPWMSQTPMEVMTLRVGTKRAKGNVIVAGLGLGHQLIEVSKRKQVKKLTLVEQSQELVDWLLPRITPHLQCGIEVVVGDAYRVMPKMRADVALVDIFRSYGSNSWERDKLRDSCRGIDFIWAWGSSDVRE
jgi:hypothetical protein